MKWKNQQTACYISVMLKTVSTIQLVRAIQVDALFRQQRWIEFTSNTKMGYLEIKLYFMDLFE